MKDLRYIKDKDKFLKYAYRALADHFSSHDDFVNYFNAIKTDELKNLFLKTASFYLFLVKGGCWEVDIPDAPKEVIEITNTYKYVAIFSLIESLSKDKYIDFYEYLFRKESRVAFPIQNRDILDEHYQKYKQEFGSIRRCISFFRSLNPDRQEDLISRLQVRGTAPSIENLAKYLYEMRSKFIHEAKLVLHMSRRTSVGRMGNKIVICKLSINYAMKFFEEGLLTHFRQAER